MNGSDKAKIKFYKDLHALLASVPKANMLAVLSDSTDLAGKDYAVWSVALGPQRIGGCNDNGLPPVRTCAEHGILLTNALCLQMRKKATWIPPRLRCWQLLDYVLVRRRDRQKVPVFKAICDTDGLTDRCLVVPRWGSDCNPAGGHKLAQHMDDLSTPDVNVTVESRRCQLLDAVHSTVFGVLSRLRRQHQDWFD
ncbi:hypothetical protein SprV_0301203500 [Sparganum proliferum]